MNIQKLVVFLDLAKTLSFTKTAEHLFTTQGTISKQIIALEKELYVQLFDRTHRKIELTEAAKLLLPYAKKIVEQYQEMNDVLETHTKKQNLSLSILTIPTMTHYAGFRHITQFLKLHPEFSIQLKEVESAEVPYYSTEQTDSIIFGRNFHEPPANFEWLPTEKDYFVAVLPAHHPLAQAKKLNLRELKDESFLLLGQQTNLYQPVIDLCHEVGFEPNIVYNGSRMDLILNMIANDMGISIVMEKTVNYLLKEDTILVPITPNRESFLAFARKQGEHSLASNTFWKYLKQNIQLLRS